MFPAPGFITGKQWGSWGVERLGMRLEKREDAKTEGGGGRVESAEWGKARRKKSVGGRELGRSLCNGMIGC